MIFWVLSKSWFLVVDPHRPILLKFGGMKRLLLCLPVFFNAMLSGQDIPALWKEVDAAIVEDDELRYMNYASDKKDMMEDWLRNTSAYLVVGLFKGVGIEISCEGPDIFSPNKEWGYTVVLECAGLKSVRVLAFMAFFYGIWRVHKFHKAFLLALLSVPVAFFINVLRLVLVVGVGHGWGQEASNSIHLFSGFLTFPVAAIAMYEIVELMKKGVRKTLKNLLKKMTGQDLRKHT